MLLSPGSVSWPPSTSMIHLHDLDRGGGERVGCASLQGDEEAAVAVAGASVSPPPSQEEDLPLRDYLHWVGVRGRGSPDQSPFPGRTPGHSLVHQLPSSGKGSSLCSNFFLPKGHSFKQDHPPGPSQHTSSVPSPYRRGQRLVE